MRHDKPATSSATGADKKEPAKSGAKSGGATGPMHIAKPSYDPGGHDREGTEGNNALQSQPDDTLQPSTTDGAKYTERSPYTAGNQ